MSTPARSNTRTPLWPIGLAACTVTAIAWTTLASPGVGSESSIVLLNRSLARLGFVLYLPIYAAAPLLRLVPGPASHRLARTRRSLGLAYALVMAAHLAAIVAWYATPEIAWEANLSTIAGGAGLALIGALAATSNDASVRLLGRPGWKGLHSATLHFLWIIYLLTYLGRVGERGLEYWPGLAVVLALPFLRAAACWKERADKGNTGR